jgi:Holliday junction resolvase-like predicted endonuclease
VGRHGQELVVVEVKTRHMLARLKPEHAVTYGKQRRIIATANRYLRELSSRPPPVRFDIVEVLYSPGQIPQCRWLQHAFTLQEAGLEWSR